MVKNAGGTFMCVHSSFKHNYAFVLPLPLPYYFTIFFQGRGARVLLHRDDAITNLGTRILKPRMRPDRGRAELEDLAAESGFR